MAQKYKIDPTPNWRTAFMRLDGAYAPSTMRGYRADVEAFETWCVANDRCAFPASVATVCAFLEEQGRKLVPSSVRRRLYAIRKAHALLQLADPTHHEDINLTFRVSGGHAPLICPVPDA